MPYNGLIVYFKKKRFARFKVSTSVMNAIVREKNPTSLTRECREFYPSFAFVRIFSLSFWVV